MRTKLFWGASVATALSVASCATDNRPSRAGSHYIKDQSIVKSLMAQANEGDADAAAMLAFHFSMGMHSLAAGEIWKKWAHDLGHPSFKEPTLTSYYKFDKSRSAKIRRE